MGACPSACRTRESPESHDEYEAEPVSRTVVAPALDDLGRDVLGGPAHGVGHLVLAEADLRQAEICQLDVAVLVDENVLGLQVAVYDIPLVQVLEGQQDLCRVELRHALGELLVAPQQIEQFSLN